MFKIESGISKPKRESKSKYPFGEMEVGDSFIVEGDQHKTRSAAFHYGKTHGKKFSVFKMPEGNYRCFRGQ